MEDSPSLDIHDDRNIITASSDRSQHIFYISDVLYNCTRTYLPL